MICFQDSFLLEVVLAAWSWEVLKYPELALTSEGPAGSTGMGPAAPPSHQPSCSSDTWTLAGAGLCFAPSLPVPKVGALHLWLQPILYHNY